MKVIETTIPPVPKPARTFSIDLTEAELFHITLILGSLTGDNMRTLYNERWRIKAIMGRDTDEFPSDTCVTISSRIYGACSDALQSQP